MDEALVNVCEPQESLELLDHDGSWPCCHCRYLVLVHADFPNTYLECDLWYVEFTLFSLYVQMIVQEPAEHSLHMLYVVLLVRRVDENVLYIGNDLMTEHGPEQVTDKALKGTGCAR